MNPVFRTPARWFPWPLLLIATLACNPSTAPPSKTPPTAVNPTTDNPTPVNPDGLVKRGCVAQCIEARQMEAIGADVIAFQCQQGCDRCVEDCLAKRRSASAEGDAIDASDWENDARAGCEQSCDSAPATLTP